MQVRSPQKANRDLPTVESAQVPASAEAQALAAANKSQDAEHQLSQPHADTSVSKEVQNSSSMPDSMADGSPVKHVCAAACTGALPQQHEIHEAAGEVLTDLVSQGPPATQPGQALLSQTSAEANAASIPCADSPSLAHAASLSRDQQQSRIPGDPNEQAPQPAEPVHVCLLALPLLMCKQEQSSPCILQSSIIKLLCSALLCAALCWQSVCVHAILQCCSARLLMWACNACPAAENDAPVRKPPAAFFIVNGIVAVT